MMRIEKSTTRWALFLLALGAGLALPSFGGERIATLEFAGAPDGLAVIPLSDSASPFRLYIRRPDGKWKHPRASVVIKDFWRRPVDGVQSLVNVDGSTLGIEFRHETSTPGWFTCELAVTDDDGDWTLSRILDDGMGRPDIRQFTQPMYAIVPDPRPRDKIAGCPVGVDTLVGSSNRELSDEKQLQLTHLLGVKWMRERIAWSWIERTPSEYDWDGSTLGGNQFQHGQRVRHIAEFAREKGIDVLQVFHGVPSWAAKPGSTPFRTFPEDLRTFHRWLGDMARTLGPSVAAWSLWNEQDIGFFCEEPPDEYAAFLKAGGLALRDVPSRPLILQGGFARDPRVGGYMDILTANGVAPYFDIYDFHTYAPLDSGRFDRAVDTHLAQAKDENASTTWLTETAFSFTKGNPPTDPANREEQVRYLIGSYSHAFERGVRRAFWHALRPAAPMSDHQYGMVNANLEPFPVYQAMAVMANTLGDGRYLGRFSLGGNGVAAQLYQDGTAEVALIDSPQLTTELGLVSAGAVALDVMGGALPILKTDGAGRVENHGWPFYLRNTAWADKITEPAPPTVTVGQRQDVSGIVLRVRYPRDKIAIDPAKKEMNWDGVASNWAPRGYAFGPDETVTVSIEVYNFSPNQVQGAVTLFALPDGASVASPKIAYDIAPGGKSILTTTLTFGHTGGRVGFEAKDQAGRLADLAVASWSPEAH